MRNKLYSRFQCKNIFVEKEFEQYKFPLTMDIMLMSEKPLRISDKVANESSNNMALPSIHPMHYSVGIRKTNHFYKYEDCYRKLSPVSSLYHELQT